MTFIDKLFYKRFNTVGGNVPLKLVWDQQIKEGILNGSSILTTSHIFLPLGYKLWNFDLKWNRQFLGIGQKGCLRVSEFKSERTTQICTPGMGNLQICGIIML